MNGLARAGRMLGNWSYRLYLASGLVLVFLVVLFTLVPPVKVGVQTGAFVLQILNGPVNPQPWITAAPVREEIAYPRPEGEGVADVYRIPDGRERAGVLIFLGANATGRDDPDVVNLGNALARAGYVTMFHWSPTMGLELNIDADELENLVWAFRHLRDQDYVDHRRVGMGGFSVGASFALVAAADTRIRDDVVFLNAFGAYYDAEDLFLQIASRSHFYEGEQEPWEVDRLTYLVFANELIETLEDPAERDRFHSHYMWGESLPPGEGPGLSDRAETVRRLLEGTSLEEARRLYQELPPDFHIEMERISPSSHVSGIRARLLIMHDQGDPMIPVAESRRLAAALEGRDDVRYTETEIFEHVRPGEGVGIGDLLREGAKLYAHMYEIVRLAAARG